MSTGRTIAISDIHGCNVALERLLELLAPQPEDCLVQLGDIVDRGPDTRRCIDLLLDLKRRCRLVHLLGNHEEMLLHAYAGDGGARSWMAFGGRETLDSYGGGFDGIPQEHLDFIRCGKDYFETDSHIFVHGNLRPEIPVSQEQVEWLRWARFQPTDRVHCSGKRVVCGHTAQRDGHPVGGTHYLCIDTCAYCRSGWLTALDVAGDTLWQASQEGQQRGPIPLAELLRTS